MKYFFLLLLTTFYLLLTFPAEAAKLEFNSAVSEIGVGQQFQVDIMLDAENEDINAVEAKISFSEELLALKEIRDGNSIISFWIERPKIKQSGAINFSGIIPSGYQGPNGFLFSIIFQAKKSGNGAIEINDVKALRNDGSGTPVSVKVSPFKISIQKGSATKSAVEPINDIEPPEEFQPEIVKNPDMFNGQWFLVFATQDKGSGIDHYKVCEKIRTTCVIAESPYVLQNQNLDRKIFVIAIDKNGNERTIILPPTAPWYKKWLVYIAWGVAVLGVIMLIRWLLRWLYVKRREC